MDIKKLSMKEKVGQRFIFGINSDNVDAIIDLIKNYYIGGVILYKNNYRNYDEMLSVIKRLKDANKDNKIPLFIAIDQEGGRVNRMPQEFKVIRNIYDVSKKDKELVYKNGYITGKMLKEAGINMNFAPVLDICEKNDSKVLYKRCISGDGASVANIGKRYVSGVNEHKVISVVKHFPGHGSSKRDSHLMIPYVYNYKDVLDKHIIPFENMMKDGVDAVMISHLIIRRMTYGLPASISYNFINQYIRKKYKFKGLVITDEINMLARNPFYRFTYLKRACFSGSDLILIKIKNHGRDIMKKSYKYLSLNKFYKRKLDASVERIINIKNKYNITDDISYQGSDIDTINQSIDELNNLC